jgi:hypothetical protein
LRAREFLAWSERWQHRPVFPRQAFKKAGGMTDGGQGEQGGFQGLWKNRLVFSIT